MSKKLTTIEVLEKFKLKHKNKYDYSKFIYVNSHTKSCIICPMHGEFWQTPYSHFIGKECKKCGNCKIGNKLSSNKTVFIEKSNIIHKNKYDYSKFIYKNAYTKGIIICPYHGEFSQPPLLHLYQKRGCKKCGIIMQKNSMIYSNDEYIHKAKLLHGNLYNYFKTNYENSHKKICIICKKHGEFWQTPNSHLCGNGCPSCIKIISKLETEFLDYIKIPQTKENRQKYIKPYKVDGFDSETNTIYEFLGDYFHGNPNIFNEIKYNKKCNKTFGELYKNTLKKFNFLKSCGYNIKYIWESDWKKFKTDLISKPKIITY